MKGKITAFILACMMVFSFAAAALAEEKPEEKKPGGMTLDEIKSMLGLSIYLQGGYTYNFRDPDSRTNELRVFDHRSNSFTLDLAQVVFAKDAAVGGAGFKLKLSAGETAQWIHALGLGIELGENPDDSDPFDLTEAYVTYIAPVGKGLKFQFGKFVTMHGAEVIEAKDNFNYSRGLLFNYAIPFTHTGLMVGYPFSDKVTLNAYVVNGWDNFDDEGKSKTLGLSAIVTPNEQVSLILNLMNGREMLGDIRSNRFLADFVATLKPIKNLTLAVNTDYAVQKNAAADGDDAKWYGIAGYVKYDFSDLFSAALRAEYFKDPDGVRTGAKQTVKEVTFTPEFRIAKNLVVRPEYRHDWASTDSFDSRHDVFNRKSQDTIALGVMYSW